MKRVFTLIIVCSFMAAGTAAAQVSSDPNRIAVTDSTGREVVTIVKKNPYDRGFQMSVAGISIDFDTPAQTRSRGEIWIDEDIYISEDEIRIDEIHIKRGDRRKHRHHHRTNRRIFYMGTVQFGFNGFSRPDYSTYPDGTYNQFLDLKNSKSIAFNLNALRLQVPVNRQKTLAFTTGIDLKWNNYAFSNRITLDRINGMLMPIELDDMLDKFKKSKLTTFAISVPAMMTINLGKVKLSGGLYADMILGQHTKWKSPKTKDKGDKAVNFAQLGITARVGFKSIYIFGNYGLTPMFKHNQGPRTQPFTIGIGF